MQFIFSFIVSLFLLCSASCDAQLMHDLHDIQKIKDNENLFIGKPLKTLLHEIGPRIKMVNALSNRPDGMPSVIFFKFITRNEYIKKTEKKTHATVIAYIKENFDWDKLRNSENKPGYDWTKTDEKIFGNFTVVGIGVLKEN